MSRTEWPIYLFGTSGLAALTHFIEPATLFGFDLDGTLAPIVSDPGAIGIPDAIRKEFTRLAAQASVAVITGRSRQDAFMRLGTAPRYLIGNHGAEGLPAWLENKNEFIHTTGDWQNQLENLLPVESRAGIVIENKGATLSIHYRQAQNRPMAHALILSAITRLLPQPRRISGKCVESLLPAGAPDKGAAFYLLMQQEGFGKGFFIGDDETDESVFRLDQENIFTVRVGKTADSQASFYLRHQREVARVLSTLNVLLERLSRLAAQIPNIGNTND